MSYDFLRKMNIIASKRKLTKEESMEILAEYGKLVAKMETVKLERQRWKEMYAAAAHRPKPRQSAGEWYDE